MKKNTLAEVAGVVGSATALGAAVYVYTHRNEPRKGISSRKAKRIGEELGIDWTRFDLEEFRRGMETELEHGRRDPATDVTGDDLLLTGKIALAHLNEFPDYYKRLARMEEEARAFWSGSATPVEEIPS
ncbi:MAG TPA: DUF5661 family protein [Thermoanaerobaculia bacterium]|nr:DUF5661 family protein [Thermoanaerobaculia bacterium]